MSEYPFNLKGKQESFSGSGREESETTESREFSLTQGVIIAEIEHLGDGDFKLEFVPAEGFSKDIATAANVTPVLINPFIVREVKKTNALTIWTPVDSKGKLNIQTIAQIKKNKANLLDLIKYRVKNHWRFWRKRKEHQENFLGPRRYHLEVESEDRWTCRFIQPDLGQFSVTLKFDEYDFNEDGDAGVHVLGPLKSGSRPVLAHVRYSGRGNFYAAAYSVDGTHQCLVFEEEGQFQIEDYPTEIKPGKEYMLHISADGAWNLKLSEVLY